MRRKLLLGVIAVSALLAAVIGGILARPYTPGDLQAFLLPQDGCQMPCFLGVRPGVMSTERAIRTLEAHPWIEAVTPDTQDPYLIRWTWNGTQPPMFAGGGHMTRNNFNLITLVTVPATIPYASVWFELGTVGGGQRLAQNAESMQSMSYGDGSYMVYFVTCPGYRTGFWRSPVILYYGATGVALSNGFQSSFPGRCSRNLSG